MEILVGWDFLGREERLALRASAEFLAPLALMDRLALPVLRVRQDLRVRPVRLVTTGRQDSLDL